MSWIVIFTIILFGISRCYLEGNILFSFTKKFCKRINFFDFLSIYLKSSLTNHAIPHYGTIYGSLLLKKKGLNYVDYIFCLTLLKLIRMVFSLLFVAILFLIFFREYLNIDNEFFYIEIFFAVLFFFFISLYIVIHILKKINIFETYQLFKKHFINN